MGFYRSRLPVLVALLCSALGSSGCGTRGAADWSAVDRCEPGASACLSSQVGQICNDQGQWATFQCAADQKCQGSTCVAVEEPCSAGTTRCLSDQVGQVCDKLGQWNTFPCAIDQVCRDNACIASDGACKVGTSQCLSTRVGQVCSQQQKWTTFQCADGETCRDNACVATDEPCVAETTQCLTAQVGQICDQQGKWISFRCATGQECREKVCASKDSPCSVGKTQCLTSQVQQVCNDKGQWATSLCSAGQSCSNGSCQGVCASNAHECLTERLQRICSRDGSSWVTSECPEGFKCANGECIGACDPGSKQCAAKSIVRECRTDGAGYVERECLENKVCDKGTCVVDASAPCYGWGNSVCQDEQTLLECRADGSGYDLKTCKDGTKCESGWCQGPTCAAGETSCTDSAISNLTGVKTCSADGSQYTISMCRARELCAFNEEIGHHECYLPPCAKGETICGDPQGAVSDTKRLSRCEILSDGKLAWVSYQCSAPSACTVDDWGAARCYAECAPGDQRCAEEENALETCGENGKWTKKSCDQTGGGTLSCIVVPTDEHVVCGDADCATLQYTLEEYQTRGRCSGAQIRKCGDDGKLQPAKTCEEGTCLPESDGFGVCKDPSRCDEVDGWRECVTDNDAYRTCSSNHWEFTLCDGDQVCTDDGQGHAACGDDCAPDTRRCAGPDYQVCSKDGTWGPSTPCASGECNPLTTRCEIACQPGEIRCVGDIGLASDGSSLGSSGMQTCQADGSWGATQECDVAAGKSCRRSGHGVHLGCVACVGDAVTGGNEENAVDSRCSAAGTGRQTCQSSNTWPTAVTACNSNEECVKRRDGTIRGTCSDDGCSSNYSRRCVSYSTLETPQTVSDCCAGSCDSDAGECLHRKSQYDPNCTDTVSCYTGRYDDDDNAIYETCCAGYCKSGQGCLRIKEQPCASVTSCQVKKLGSSTVCCGTCQSDGSCPEGLEAEHPIGEYFTCGSTTSLCWSIGSCTWVPGSGVSGAMYANCKATD